jgi:hypothetical protein
LLEQDRQKRIRQATDRINALFNGGTSKVFDGNAYLKANPDVAKDSFWGSMPELHYEQFGQKEGRAPTYSTMTVDSNARQGLYDEQRDAVFDINKRDIDRQYEQAERNNRFGLARSGLFGGSADVDSNALLQRTENEGLLKAGGIADSAAADLKMSDERSRQNLTNMAQSGIDTGTLSNMGLNELSANKQGANAFRSGATIGNLFGDLGNAYLQNQQMQGLMAGMDKYTNPYSKMSTRSTYGGDTYNG